MTDSSPFAHKLWLAPLTRGGHPAFRSLCVSFGARVTVGEMVVVRNLLRDKASEFALLRSHPEEPFFGVQLADKKPETLTEGARIAEQRGARFVDLNCGCPIFQITGRGLGASLLKKPGRLARLVAGLRAAVAVPVTVKIRTGWSGAKINVSEVARACEEAGAAAITIHGRSREQRYSQAADWDLIGRVAAERTIPVVGNGDILTHFEARTRMERSGVTSIMLARGALIKPWLFREIREGRSWLPTAEERLGVLWNFVGRLREHFHDDERGRRRMMGFLPWHLGFFCRYRPLPEEEFGVQALAHPLLQTRMGIGTDLSPLEGLLRDPRVETHEELARALIESGTQEEALARALSLAASRPLFVGEAEAGSAAADLVAG